MARLCRTARCISTLTLPDLPDECCVIEVSPLMQQLIIEAIDIPLLYDETGRDGRVIRLILDEICAAPKVPVHVPMPTDARPLRICKALLADPGREGDLEDWARFGALGRRTLTRLFRDETGITFTLWRQQVRLMEALRRLSMGTAVTTVAMDLGYESPSAFTAMFRRVMGKTPKHYLGPATSRWTEAGLRARRSGMSLSASGSVVVAAGCKANDVTEDSSRFSCASNC